MLLAIYVIVCGNKKVKNNKYWQNSYQWVSLGVHLRCQISPVIDTYLTPLLNHHRSTNLARKGVKSWHHTSNLPSWPLIWIERWNKEACPIQCHWSPHPFFKEDIYTWQRCCQALCIYFIYLCKSNVGSLGCHSRFLSRVIVKQRNIWIVTEYLSNCHWLFSLF